jgi:8-oxo-dGTP diphosphatase
VALRQPLPGRRYKVGGRPKVVHYWRAELLADKGLEANNEVDEVAWLTPKAAGKRLSHPLDAELAELAREPLSTPFVVLRHAHATKRVDWSGKDPKRPLDVPGFEQAIELVPRMAAYGIEQIHTSAATRCVQSVQPYADVVGAPLILEPDLTEEGYAESPNAAQQRASGLLADAANGRRPTVLCGHRPYLPELLDHLLEDSGLTGPQDTVPVASMIVLHTAQGAKTLTIRALEHHLP